MILGFFHLFWETIKLQQRHTSSAHVRPQPCKNPQTYDPVHKIWTVWIYLSRSQAKSQTGQTYRRASNDFIEEGIRSHEKCGFIIQLIKRKVFSTESKELH